MAQGNRDDGYGFFTDYFVDTCLERLYFAVTGNTAFGENSQHVTAFQDLSACRPCKNKDGGGRTTDERLYRARQSAPLWSVNLVQAVDNN